MNHSNVTKEYYVRHDGTFDELAALLNCFQAAMYFTLKTRYGIDRPYELFLQDPSFKVQLEENGNIRNIDLLSRWNCYEVFSTEDVQGRGRETMAEVEQILDQGEIALFETHTNRVPFHRNFISLDFHYDESFHNSSVNNHIFVALGHTETHFIYTEAPPLLRPDYVPYNNSKCIGMIEKDVLAVAAECFFNYRRVHISEQGLSENNFVRRVRSVLEQMIANANVQQAAGMEFPEYYNADGLSALIRSCELGQLKLDQQCSLYELKVCSMLEWKFSLIRQQKSILLECIIRHPALFGDFYAELTASLKQHIDMWQLIISKLRLLLLRRSHSTDGLAAMLEKVRQSEDSFMEVLQLWHEKYAFPLVG